MTAETRPGLRARREIAAAALARFAAEGFGGTSIQHVADDSGYAKSSVLYHFASKELMLDAALTPALDELDRILREFPRERELTRSQVQALLAEFVDFLLAYRREAAIILTQGANLAEIPVMQRASQLMQAVSDVICAVTPDLTIRLRVGVGLAGAAFVLATGESYAEDLSSQPDEDVRAALLGILAELFQLDS